MQDLSHLTITDVKLNDMKMTDQMERCEIDEKVEMTSCRLTPSTLSDYY